VALLWTFQLGMCGRVAGIAFSIPAALYMLVVLVVLLSRGISYSSVLNSPARLKIDKYKVAVEEWRATF